MNKEAEKTLKVWTTRSVRAVMQGKGNREQLLALTLERYGEWSVEFLTKMLDEAEHREEGTYYCGRCLRFLDVSNFNDSQMIKIDSGEPAHCSECMSGELVTHIEEDGTITRERKERSEQEKRQYTRSAQMNEAMPEVITQWLRSPGSPDLVLGLVNYITQRQVEKTFIEIVLPSGKISTTLISLSKKWLEVRGTKFMILSTIVPRYLTEEEVSVLNELSMYAVIERC
jgi:hypothetical protein